MFSPADMQKQSMPDDKHVSGPIWKTPEQGRLSEDLVWSGEVLERQPELASQYRSSHGSKVSSRNPLAVRGHAIGGQKGVDSDGR